MGSKEANLPLRNRSPMRVRFHANLEPDSDQAHVSQGRYLYSDLLVMFGEAE